MRNIVYAAVVFTALPLVPITQAASAGWPDGLAAALTAASNGQELTDSNVAAVLTPWVVFDQSACKTARLPSPASAAPISSSLVVYENDEACDRQTTLLLLQFYLNGTARELGRLRTALAAHLPSPCFSGILPPADPRRHVPPQRLIAWRSGHRLVVVAQDASIPDAASISLVVSGPAKGQGAALRDDVLEHMPATCR